MVSVQYIIDTGFVNETIDTATLEEARATLEFQIQGFGLAEWGPIGHAWIDRHRLLLERIQTLLKKRYGSDGMTPLGA